MTSSNQTVTIVLNSHNRPAALVRILGVIIQHYENIKILIVDSSKLSKRPEIEEFVHQNTDPSFVEISTFSETTPTFKKLLVAANKATTKYIQYFADDDAVCPDTIIDRVDFLEDNVEFSACLGRQYYCEKN
jgi:glycosyltransferase domain-containing protein